MERFYLRCTKLALWFRIPSPRVLQSSGLARSCNVSMRCLCTLGTSSESMYHCSHCCSCGQSTRSVLSCCIGHAPCDSGLHVGHCVISGTRIPHICAACSESFESRMWHPSSPASSVSELVQVPSSLTPSPSDCKRRKALIERSAGHRERLAPGLRT